LGRFRLEDEVGPEADRCAEGRRSARHPRHEEPTASPGAPLVGDITRLTGLTWSSNDPSVTFNSIGEIQTTKTGTFMITATLPAVGWGAGRGSRATPYCHRKQADRAW
jgi:hypothetical protein